MKYPSQLRLVAIRLGHFLFILLVGAGVRLPAEDHTTTILDGVTNDLAGPFILGDTGPFNFLLLTNGAALTDTIGIVGNSIDAQANSAIVTGANSVWQHGSNFVLGAMGGLNEVSILDGARLKVGWQAFLGLDQFSGGNHLFVSGSNSFLDMPWFHLGLAGSGNQITVADGARAGRGISNDILNNIGEEETSAGNLLYLTGPGTSWYTDGFRVGHSGPANGVVVNDGARLTNGFLTIGRNSPSTHNYVEVLGTGSVFKVQGGSALIGFGGGANLLRVAGGARLDTPLTTIGQSNSAAGNRAEIFGPGTFWSNAGSFIIGQDGAANALILTSGAALQSGSTMVGNNSSDNLVMVSASASARSGALAVGVGTNASGNILQIRGPGTIWTNSGAATIGISGSGNSLLISNGAVLIQSPGSGASLILGSNVTSRGNLIAVSGTNSHLNYQTKCTFGASGSDNRVILADGGRLTTASAAIGGNCLAAGNVLLATGPGTLWNSGIADVGICSTNNSIIISNGANAFLTSVRSSVQGGLGNSIVVTGPQSLFRSSSELNIGNSGVSNTLFILDGARVESGRDYLGFAGSENAVLVHGAGTTWSNGSLTFGSNRGSAPFTGSRNRLALADGATLDSGTLTLGAGNGTGENAVHVSGAGAFLNVRTNLVIGLFGTNNQVSISAGAGSAAQSVFLGASAFLAPVAGFPSHANRLSLDGNNSVLTITGNLWVGYIGNSNRLEIRDGAQVNSQSGVLGAGSGASRSSALIRGAGAVWNNLGDLTVGAAGSGHLLTISHGGVARSRIGVVGLSGLPVGSGSTCVTLESSSKVLVTDPGSLWANEGQLHLGRQAIGNSLIVSNGAAVSAGGLLIGESSGISPGSFCAPLANANLLTIAGGCLAVTNAAHNAVLEPRFGTLTLSSGLVVADYLVTTNNDAPGRVDLHGGTLRIGHAQWQSTTPLDVGDGLHAARFHIPNGSAYFAGSLTIRPHGRLIGSAAIQTAVTNSGIIEPGNRDNGYMSFNGPFVQTPGGVLSFSIGGPETTADYTSMFVIPAAVFDGNLCVALRGGFQPSTNDWYRIIGCPTRSGEFANAPDRGRLLTADRLGSFLVLYTNFAVVLTDYRSTDLDGDGLDDTWASANFGHSPLTPAEKLGDADHDGASNCDEFRAGTDPHDPASVFKASLTYANGRATLLFPSAEGRNYSVESSADLATWTSVSDPTFAYPVPGLCEWTDDGKDTGGPGAAARFYRVTVE